MEKQKLDYAQTTVCLYSIKDQPNMLLFLSIMLCCSALKIHLLYSILCSRTIIVVRLLWYLYTILHEQFTKCNRKFVKTVLLECINKGIKSIMFNHTMTVLLEYINRSLQFFTNA